jgi:diacylglycerol kinase (ATP)
MSSREEVLPDVVNPQKGRTGFSRVWHATGYSMAGCAQAGTKPRSGSRPCLSFVMVPLAFWVGRTWVEVALLAGSVLLVMMVELLNTGIETAIDRIGLERHDLSKRAKDMGSAAVFLSLLLAGGVWAAGLWHFFFA